ncbi:L-fucose mutarotase [Sphingomonas spermidinifaciens]|uniref:L-fucose mutarotase n=1 Tax=Sphingomonas spermidinifaciens TaxID=1141889 RepID=A0A2A4B799_9SPHN|nr:L-rhamnose mutarotase [Sphingomonas spermidinifaciens]PCD03659.1 L-fucose mutarotase [Sphingomonas spermidinifaciens]
MSIEHVLMLDLHDDPELIAEYERYHAPGAGWPEIEASIRRSGIEAMRIYRLDTRLVMVIEVDDSFDFAAKARADAADPAVQRWEKLMSRFQRVGPDGAKWRRAERIFDLATALRG